MRWLPVLLLMALVVGGCVQPAPPLQGEAPKSLILRFTLIDTRTGEAEHRGASPGLHCGEAYPDDDPVRIERGALDRIGSARPFLIVEPGMKGKWYTTGHEAYLRALPAKVGTGIEEWEEDRLVGTIGWNQGPMVNGVRVVFGHTWTVEDGGDDWRAEAKLERGPDAWETWRGGYCD